jgi:hypothetical protein
MGFHPVAVVRQKDTTHKITRRSNETQYTKLHIHNKGHATQNENTTITTTII